ncbi:MAG: L-threonylcarbamoyladenylate synthase [Candidatus Tantalella remota]|nr:L-threonylcarbamoyladenylate synthase [Candidatus Tantalella remota]
MSYPLYKAMKPRVFNIDPVNIDLRALKRSAEVIHNRGLVAFPTETVYGLGANALDPKAVAKIFEAKKRPLDDPLIVHISDINDLFNMVLDVPLKIHKLVHRFWPGPLTIVLKKTNLVPDLVTTGLDTVAVRMPSGVIARKFIEIAKTPIAAPSANLFGRPSPTTAKHVIDDLEGRIDVVLDGGSTEIGIESTVVECVDDRIVVLRPGGIDLEELRGIIGDVEVLSSGEDPTAEHTPGKYPQHYSPRAKVVVVEDTPRQVDEVLEKASRMVADGKKTGILARQEHSDLFKDYNVKMLGPGDDSRICASRLFHMLREFDADNVNMIIAEGIPKKGLGLAVMNRLRKAAGPDSI